MLPFYAMLKNYLSSFDLLTARRLGFINLFSGHKCGRDKCTWVLMDHETNRLNPVEALQEGEISGPHRS